MNGFERSHDFVKQGHVIYEDNLSGCSYTQLLVSGRHCDRRDQKHNHKRLKIIGALATGDTSVENGVCVLPNFLRIYISSTKLFPRDLNKVRPASELNTCTHLGLPKTVTCQHTCLAITFSSCLRIMRLNTKNKPRTAVCPMSLAWRLYILRIHTTQVGCGGGW